MPRSNARATEAQLNRLHRLVVKSLNKELTAALKKGGSVPASLLAAAIKMLQVNSVDSPEKEKVPLSKLRDSLPTFDDEGEVNLAGA